MALIISSPFRLFYAALRLFSLISSRCCIFFLRHEQLVFDYVIFATLRYFCCRLLLQLIRRRLPDAFFAAFRRLIFAMPYGTRAPAYGLRDERRAERAAMPPLMPLRRAHSAARCSHMPCQRSIRHFAIQRAFQRRVDSFDYLSRRAMLFAATLLPR